MSVFGLCFEGYFTKRVVLRWSVQLFANVLKENLWCMY